MGDLLLLQTGGTDNLLLQVGDNLLLQTGGAAAGKFWWFLYQSMMGSLAVGGSKV